jgi:alpha-1,6-mannosyltransferase
VENIANTDLGVDVDIFQPAESAPGALRRELEIPADRTLLLYVGRLAAEKNVGTLFEAFEKLHAREPGRFHLLSVGDGTRRSELEHARETTGAVSWMPYCGDAAQLARIYRAADLFVHPGILETFGLVTLEAQACGTPVVGIRGSYMDRIIFTNQGHWAGENTPAALADAIDAATRTDLVAAGAEASRTVRERYAWGTIFGRLFAIYRTVIAEYNP